MSFGFEKGSDLVIKVNGEIAGGVFELVRRVVNRAEGIYEFLTDKPVALLPRCTYEVELHMRSGVNRFFDGDIGSVEVIGESRTERYTLCTVKSIESRALPRGEVDYTVKIEAEERSFLNG